MAKFALDPAKPPQLSDLSDAEITAAAEADIDNEPQTPTERNKLRTAQVVKHARQHSGLSQQQFAKAYHITLARLRDLEMGRTHADSALLACLTLIERDPISVQRVLAAE